MNGIVTGNVMNQTCDCENYMRDPREVEEEGEDEVKEDEEDEASEGDEVVAKKDGDGDEMSLIDWAFSKKDAKTRPTKKTTLSTAGDEREFRAWWIRRYLTFIHRPIIYLTFVTLVVFIAYVMLNLMMPAGNFNAGTGAAQDGYTANEVVPQFIVGWLGLAAFAACTNAVPLKRWTVIYLSHLASLTMLICSTCLVLVGFTYPNNDKPTPFIFGLIVVMWAGTPVGAMWPMWISHFWTPMLMPVFFVFANATNLSVITTIPAAVPVQCILLTQCSMLCCYNIVIRERHVRVHFFSVRKMFVELTRMENVLGLLLPPSLLTTSASASASASASSRDNDVINGISPSHGEANSEYIDIISAAKDIMLCIRYDHFAESFDDGAILIAEVFFKDAVSPLARLQILDHVFLRFDDLVKQAGVLKIETIAGVYMVAANIAHMYVDRHVETLCRLTFEFLNVIPEITSFFHLEPGNIYLKAGINNGPITAGVIGRLLPRYRVFGDTVNTAARMETSSLPNCIQLTSNAANCVFGSFTNYLKLVVRKEMNIKGKGAMLTYFAYKSEGYKSDSHLDDDDDDVNETRVNIRNTHRTSFVDVAKNNDPLHWQTIVSKLKESDGTKREREHPPHHSDKRSNSLDLLMEGATDAVGFAYFQYRYALLWWPSRVIRVIEPVSTALICGVLTYVYYDKFSGERLYYAATLSSLLVASFAIAVAHLVYGSSDLSKLPAWLSWSTLQKLEMVPVILHACILSQWSRIVGHVTATPVWVMLFTLGNAAYFNNVMRPGHSAAATVIIYAQHLATTAYDAATTLHPISRIDTMFVLTVCLAYFTIAFFVNWGVHERTWRTDFQVISRAKLLHDVSESIMCNFLPPSILQAVQERARAAKKSRRRNKKKKKNVDDILAWEFDNVCVLQSDISGFTALGARISPQALCSFLHMLFSHFDDLASRFGVNKIETVGDAFIAATGCIPGDTRTLAENATALVNMANKMQLLCAQIRAPDDTAILMRIGLHCGPLVGGVVGGHMLRYHLFGSTMDVVTQLEQACAPGQILISNAFALALRGDGGVHKSESFNMNRLLIKRSMSRIFQHFDSFDSRTATNQVPLFDGSCHSQDSETKFEFYPAGVLNLMGLGVQDTFHVITFGPDAGSSSRSVSHIYEVSAS